jgi:uncharacterized membrane protein
MLFAHVLGSVIWVGGMFLMHYAVRPAAVRLLEPPQRVPLLTAILGTFFNWVAGAVLVILASGLAMITGAGGLQAMHLSVLLMFALGVVMMLVFAYIRFGVYVALRAAVDAKDWPAGAANLDQIRKLVAFNLVLGVLTIGVVTLGRALL